MINERAYLPALARARELRPELLLARGKYLLPPARYILQNRYGAIRITDGESGAAEGRDQITRSRRFITVTGADTKRARAEAA